MIKILPAPCKWTGAYVFDPVSDAEYEYLKTVIYALVMHFTQMEVDEFPLVLPPHYIFKI
jgi:hypothetical protein